MIYAIDYILLLNNNAFYSENLHIPFLAVCLYEVLFNVVEHMQDK